MRIGIDCRLAGIQHAGIGRYTANLVTRMVRNHPEVTWVLFFSTQAQAQGVLEHQLQSSNVEIVLINARHYSLWEQIQLPIVFSNAHLDLLHVPHFNVPLLYTGKLVVTIHDLLWHQKKGMHVTTLPAWKYWLKYGFYRYITRHAVTKANRVYVPAHTVKKTVTAFFPQAEHKIVVTYEGVDDALKHPLAASSQKPHNKTLLYVGSLYPHKNVDVVIKALAHLPEYALRVVSARGVFLNRLLTTVDKVGVTDQVEFLGYLPDAALLEEYRNAHALVQPSLSEGFGLPGLEAIAAGTSVIASDIPIFKEIYQDAALFFDPSSSESFKQTLLSLTPTKASELRAASRLVLQRYSWDTMADQTFAEYQRVLLG